MSRIHLLDILTSPLFFESFERFAVNEDDFLVPVKKMLRGEWSFTRRSVWFNCTPPEGRARELPAQGWKIHVSSAVTNALDILAAVVPVLDAQDVSFKFSLDRNILQLMNGKGWERQGSGKFITIYPTSREEFMSLLETLHETTRGLDGIYILSDRRYKDSKVLFYRYGSIRSILAVNEKGEQVSMLSSPSGERIPDERKPVFYVPPWEHDPFPAEEADPLETDEEGRIALKQGRYVVTGVLGYTNSGGVYVANDTETRDEVIVKEARPFVHFGQDSIGLLRKEHRLLSQIAAAGESFAPRPIDFFQDWEHYFLVQERIEGLQLRAFSAANNATLLTSPRLADTEVYFTHFKEIFRQVAHIVARLHGMNIVFSDLSPANVLVTENHPLQVRIIDFEAAHELGVDPPPRVYTLGFAYRDQMGGEATRFEDDYFALGALMHYFIAPFNQIFGVSPRSRFTFVKSVVQDLGYPPDVHELIVASLDNDGQKRPRPGEIIAVLEREHDLREPKIAIDDETAHPTYEAYVDGISEYCLALADYERTDRLFPAYGAIFHTNPLSLAYGACGVAHALQFMGRDVPDAVVDWILQPTSERDTFPPGLYMGLCGLAWTVLDLGQGAAAERILTLSHRHPLRESSPDLFNGIAGWGLTQLKFFLDLGDEQYLARAIEAGELLLASAKRDEEATHWGAGDTVPLGLGHGASGISLFLLYLSLATEREEFLRAGVDGLDYDLRRGITTRDGGLSWRRYDDDATIIYPYWRYGSAGIGMVLVRYYRLLGEDRYREYLEKIFIDLNRKYAVYPGLFVGLAGVGETLLDFHLFTGERRFSVAAHRVATGLSLFRIERDEGLAFPGDGLSKICCDLATGSAGIGRFFHRLVNGGRAPLLLDELILRDTTPRPVCKWSHEPALARAEDR